LSNGIPAADGSISGVWFKWALHWLLQPEIIVRELARVLKRGGWAYISTLTIDDVAVSCETFLRSKFLLTDLQARFPQAEITAGVNRVNGAEIWVVNHAAAIDEYFAGHPSAQTYSYFKSPDSTMPKFITGFQPAYFTMTARNYGLNIVGMQLEKNKDFPNGFADNDPRSKSRIHLLLAKP
jgi:ubiquinone/menaquinone biosynthesis C-methylase UbiE